MPTATDRRADHTVAWSELARELGITRPVRQNIMDEGLVRPIRPPHPGRPTEIPADDAERVRAAVLLAAAVGLAVIVVLRLLAGTGATVSGSGVTIPVPGP
jgi:hypothetical protein